MSAIEKAAEIRRLRKEAEVLRNQNGETAKARASYRLEAAKLERSASELERNL